MRRVVIESPYAAFDKEGVEFHKFYARRCMRHSIKRGEAPLASHLLYTQMLDDKDARERDTGIDCGYAWMGQAELVVFYTDLGISPGMRKAITIARKFGIPTEFRRIYNDDRKDS